MSLTGKALLSTYINMFIFDDYRQFIGIILIYIYKCQHYKMVDLLVTFLTSDKLKGNNQMRTSRHLLHWNMHYYILQGYMYQNWPYEYLPCDSGLKRKITLNQDWIGTSISLCQNKLIWFRLRNVINICDACAIWYHLYNLNNVKNTYGGVLLLAKWQAKILQLY